MVKSKGALQRYLGLDSKDFKEYWEQMADKGVQVPIDWLRAQDDRMLTALLGEQRTLKGVAKYIGVSFTSVEKVYSERFQSNMHVGFITEDMSGEPGAIQNNLKRLGSVQLFCRVYNWTPVHLREWFEENGHNINDYIDVAKSGKNEAAKGRKAELFYMELKGELAIEDLNKTAGSKALSDVKMFDGSLVNVKASSQKKTKGTTRTKRIRYWTFGMSGMENSDFMGCVMYDAKFDNPLYHCDIKTSELDLTKKSFTIRETEFEQWGVKEL
jgi:hypothetical protein